MSPCTVSYVTNRKERVRGLEPLDQCFPQLCAQHEHLQYDTNPVVMGDSGCGCEHIS